jgi:hypothetical protein
MKQKFLRIEMEDGSKWDVPARIIADNRARYYVEYDSKQPDNEMTKEEIYNVTFTDTMNDDSEIYDWAANNMNWSDVEIYAVKVLTKEVNFEEGWRNGEKEVIEK